MKFKFFLLLFCSCCMLTSCAKRVDDKEPPNIFFAWTEGYLASPLEEESSLALTIYYKGSADLPFLFSEVSNITFQNISEQMISFQFTIEPLDIDDKNGYLAYAVYFTYKPKQIGVFESESVIFTLNNNETLTYSFGNLVFDIDETDSKMINTWESEIATSNSTLFPYNYFSEVNNAIITKIQVGIDNEIFNAKGLNEEGKITLDGNYSAPLVIIKSKLLVECEGALLTSYGKGCYCGATNVQESILEKSLTHWLEQ